MKQVSPISITLFVVLFILITLIMDPSWGYLAAIIIAYGVSLLVGERISIEKVNKLLKKGP